MAEKIVIKGELRRLKMYIGEDNVIVELAQMEEAKPCMRIIDDARAFQQAQGFTQ